MPYIKGIDISNNNGSIDFSKVASDSVEYIYVKATEGATFQDSTMVDFYNNCKSNNLKVGAYHFLVGTSTPEAQAQNFYSMIKDYDWDLMPFVDVETNFDELADYLVRFIAAFKQLSPLTLGIYSYTGFIGNLTGAEETIKNIALWEANYNNDPWNVPSNDIFNNRVGHQYTETGSIAGVNSNCDVNVFTEGVLIALSGEWIQGTGEDSSKWWYKHSHGSYTKADWEKINGEWYYFDYKGWMCTGWIVVKEKDYLLDSNGAMYHDTIAYGYSFDSNGVATKLN